MAVALLVVYWQALLGYLRDQHYQEHFVYLWVFLAGALWRTLRGPFRSRFSTSSRRDRLGVSLSLLATLLLAASAAVGSSTGMRSSLVLFLTGAVVLLVPRWGVKRCLAYGLLMQLCFGIPYSVYFPLTSELQWGVATFVSLPARLGLADYTVDATVVQFPHYQLAITPDCSGLGQLLTFVGIAALGVLSSARQPRRSVLILGLAIVLAWLSNLARVGMFVGFVAVGWTKAVDDSSLHAALGFLAFLPFVTVLVAVVLKTHVPMPMKDLPPIERGRFAIAWLLVPLLSAHFGLGRDEERDFPEPPYFAALESPPGHQLDCRAPSEEVDRAAYATRWLVNARFQRSATEYFDLLHYATRSHSHLCVHKIAACLDAPGQRVRYEPPVVIDGKAWWRISLDRESAEMSLHVYFAFEVAGERRDDSSATQFAVFRQRLLGGSWEVRLTRVVLPGPLPAAVTPYETEVLTWLGGLTSGAR